MLILELLINKRKPVLVFDAYNTQKFTENVRAGMNLIFKVSLN